MKYQPNRNYVSNDKVMTPPPLARAIVDVLQPSGLLLEPCAGDGAFVEALRPFGDVEWCEIEKGRDFFSWTRHVDWIITNPPWSQFRRFLEHAMTVADNICFLAPMPHWWTTCRYRLMKQAGFFHHQWLFVEWPPVAGWRAEGFQLCATHIARG